MKYSSLLSLTVFCHSVQHGPPVFCGGPADTESSVFDFIIQSKDTGFRIKPAKLPAGLVRNDRTVKLSSIVLTAALVLLPSLAFAQERPPASATRDIEQIGAEVKAFEKPPGVVIPEEQKRPPIEEPIAVEEGVEFPKREVFIREIAVEGNTVFPDEEIKKITSGYENRTIMLSELNVCAKAITALYRKKGYVTSQAYLPPQKIMEGKVLIKILEGRVGETKIQGEKHFKAYGIRRLIDLRKGSVLKVQKLEDSLVRINRNPDVAGRAVLAPGEERGTTDIVISVKDRFPMHAGHQYDNLGTKFSGRNRQNIIFTHNNFLTLNDRMISRFLISERHNFIGVSSSYAFPIDARGDTFNMNFSHVALELGKALKRFEIRGRSTSFGPSFTFPILMTPHWEADFSSGFDFTTVLTRIAATEDSRDDLRVLRFGPNISEFDKWGRTVLTNEFSQGFSGFLGSSDKKDDHASREGAGGQFFSWGLGLARFQRFFFDQILVMRLTSQVTPDRLVSSEEYRVGGMETVRGYPEGDFLGDKGYTYSVELRMPPYFIPKDLELFGQKPREAFQLVGFLDNGRAWTTKTRATEIGNKVLIGIGGGVLVDLFDHFTARVYLAQAIGDDPSDGDNFRIHFLLSTEF